jgi:hypothetical protein
MLTGAVLFVINNNMLKKWRCIIKLSDGWQTETIVQARDHSTAMKFAEAQTGGKCLAAYPMQD